MSLRVHFTFRGCYPSGQRLALILEAPTMLSGIQWRIINEQPTLEVFTWQAWQAWQAGQLVGCFSREELWCRDSRGHCCLAAGKALCLALGRAKNRNSGWGGKSLVWEGSCLSWCSIAMKRHCDQGNSYQRKRSLGLADCFRGVAYDHHAKKQAGWRWNSS